MAIHSTQQAHTVIQSAKVVLDSLDNSSLTSAEREDLGAAGRTLNSVMRRIETRTRIAAEVDARNRDTVIRAYENGATVYLDELGSGTD